MVPNRLIILGFCFGVVVLFFFTEKSLKGMNDSKEY